MKMRMILFSCCLSVSLFASNSTIIETNKIEDILSYVDQETLVIFDLDGVVILPKQTLGVDPWVGYEGKKYEASVEDLRGWAAYWPVWLAVQERIEMKLVDEKILTVLDMLKAKDIPVMGFTARGVPLADRTKEQLKGVNVSLEENNWWSGESFDGLFHFKHGILFRRTGVEKGECLESFLNTIAKWPKKILFVDDKERNVKGLEELCRKKDISFIGVRYSATDNEPFDPVLSDIQLYMLQNLGIVLSDKQAEDMKNFFERVLQEGGDFQRSIK